MEKVISPFGVQLRSTTKVSKPVDILKVEKPVEAIEFKLPETTVKKENSLKSEGNFPSRIKELLQIIVKHFSTLTAMFVAIDEE